MGEDVRLEQLAEQAARRIRGYLRSPESNEIRIRPLIVEALDAATQALREQLADAQEGRRTLAHQLERRAGGRDDLTKSLREQLEQVQLENASLKNRLDQAAATLTTLSALAEQRDKNYTLAVTERNKARDLAAEWRASYHRLRTEHERLKGN